MDVKLSFINCETDYWTSGERIDYNDLPVATARATCWFWWHSWAKHFNVGICTLYMFDESNGARAAMAPLLQRITWWSVDWKKVNTTGIKTQTLIWSRCNWWEYCCANLTDRDILTLQHAANMCVIHSCVHGDLDMIWIIKGIIVESWKQC